VLHVLEVVIALCGTGRAAEVVERDGGDPTLGKPQCQLLVEPVKAAHVREDHDADLAWLVGSRREGRKAVAVSRLENEILVGYGGAANRRDRRHGVEFEAHGSASLSPSKDGGLPGATSGASRTVQAGRRA
jgi:hypothetical protein